MKRHDKWSGLSGGLDPVRRGTVAARREARSTRVPLLCNLPQRRPNRSWLGGLRHEDHIGLRYRSREIIVQRIQAVRLQFPKYTSQCLLNSIYRVKEIAAIHLHLPAAKPPIGAQQKVIPEYQVVGITQVAAAHEAEIGDVILVETGVAHPYVLTHARDQTDLAHELLFGDTLPEPRVTGAKYGSQHAIAWCRAFFEIRLLPFALASNAERFRKPDRLWSIPFHRLAPTGFVGRHN